MFFDLHCVLGLTLAGFLLLGIGFSLRQSEWGIGLLGLGALVTLSPLYYKLLMTFS